MVTSYLSIYNGGSRLKYLNTKNTAFGNCNDDGSVETRGSEILDIHFRYCDI